MRNRNLLLALFPMALAIPALAQSSEASDGYDFDTLGACSIIYQRIGEIYNERGEAAKAQEFQNTAYAYSASAFHMLQYQTEDQGGAYEYGEERMQLITQSLNEISEAGADGEMGVIGEWLPYCDTLGQGVTEILHRREETGW